MTIHQAHKPTKTSRKDIEPTSTRISAHAKLRAMMRLGAIENAAEHVRELLADAVPIEDDRRFPNCRAYRHGNVTIVIDHTDDVVKTVVKEVRE